MDILVQEVLIHSHRSGSQLAGSPFFESENHCAVAGDQGHPVARSSGTSRRLFFFGTLRARQLPAGYLVVQCAHLEK